MIVKLLYRGREFHIKDDYPYKDEGHDVPYMWEEGNFSCDCNKSELIKQQCDKDFPDMPCGDLIQLLEVVR